MRRRRGTRIALALTLVAAAGPFAVPAAETAETAEALRRRVEERIRARAEAVDGVLGAWVEDLETGEGFGVHEDEVFPAASAIKLAVLVELFRQADAGRLRLDAPYRLAASDKAGGSGVLDALGDGTVELSLRDLAVLMILVSDNTATNVLIDRVGFDAVNETLDGLGLARTRLRRKMIRPDEQARGNENVATPRELARLLRLVYRGEAASAASCREMLAILALPKRGPLRAKLPPGVRVAHKTGSLAGVRNDAGIVFVEGRPFVVAAMSAWMEDEAEAEEAIAAIGALAFSYFRRLAGSNAFGAGLPPR